MERMKLEQLARLVDEQPTPEEQAMLDGDPRLRREMEALRAQTRSLGNLPDMLPPPGGWHQLERRLVSVGLISNPARPFGWRRWLQAAAILVVFIGGTAVGWVTGSGRDSEEPANLAAVMPNSLDDARLAVENGQRQYRKALQTYQEISTPQGGVQFAPNPAKRLSLLKAVGGAIYMATEVAPADPFLNELLLAVGTEYDRESRRLNVH